jgi:hypothetical protein
MDAPDRSQSTNPLKTSCFKLRCTMSWRVSLLDDLKVNRRTGNVSSTSNVTASAGSLHQLSMIDTNEYVTSILSAIH